MLTPPHHRHRHRRRHQLISNSISLGSIEFHHWFHWSMCCFFCLGAELGADFYSICGPLRESKQKSIRSKSNPFELVLATRIKCCKEIVENGMAFTKRWRRRRRLQLRWWCLQMVWVSEWMHFAEEVHDNKKRTQNFRKHFCSTLLKPWQSF